MYSQTVKSVLLGNETNMTFVVQLKEQWIKDQQRKFYYVGLTPWGMTFYNVLHQKFVNSFRLRNTSLRISIKEGCK